MKRILLFFCFFCIQFNFGQRAFVHSYYDNCSFFKELTQKEIENCVTIKKDSSSFNITFKLPLSKNLKEFANPKEVKEACIKINSYENIADDVLSQGIVDVFESNDPIKIIKVKSVLEYLEIVTDKAEDVANTIENIVIKYA